MEIPQNEAKRKKFIDEAKYYGVDAVVEALDVSLELDINFNRTQKGKKVNKGGHKPVNIAPFVKHTEDHLSRLLPNIRPRTRPALVDKVGCIGYKNLQRNRSQTSLKKLN